MPIGPFIADFACIEKRLVVEVDGGQHVHPEAADGERTRVLAGHGFAVVRFWNTEVLQNLDGVLATIAR